ncbi:MAG: PKD domain-containing protein [Cytophagales bacterium]|nr:PKD domain-containing protein [Cytophagales bacterium]MCA6372360.1 PKD domain-containing protein [Cytophagales bacterium]MCA6382506.1 PKD domain-containing protein [Cytophagales bacterium]
MKNNVKNISLLIITVAAMLSSCDQRFEFLATVNKEPIIYFQNEKTVVTLTDSLKTSLKNGKSSFPLTLSFSDPENQLKSVTLGIAGGNGIFRKDNVPVNSLDPSDASAHLEFLPDATGPYTLSFVATDAFGKTATATISLLVFLNLPPVASLTESKLAVNSPFEYQFDASKSFDQDKNKGGSIQAYRYLINGTTEIITQQPIIKYVFSKAGGQEVKLEVFDNDGVKSATVTRVIQVQ